MVHDLTHPLATGLPVFPGDPAVRIERDDGLAPWRVCALHLGTHSGTHADAPLQSVQDGNGIGAYPPQRFVRHGLLLAAGGRAENAALGVDLLAPVREAIAPGAIVVLRTGWDRYWGEPHDARHPYIEAALADAPVAARVGLVGIDAPNVDSTPDGGAAAHACLLGADILIVENLRGLAALTPGRPYVFAFVPLSLGDLDGAPVGALAWDVGHDVGGDR